MSFDQPSLALLDPSEIMRLREENSYLKQLLAHEALRVRAGEVVLELGTMKNELSSMKATVLSANNLTQLELHSHTKICKIIGEIEKSSGNRSMQLKEAGVRFCSLREEHESTVAKLNEAQKQLKHTEHRFITNKALRAQNSTAIHLNNKCRAKLSSGADITNAIKLKTLTSENKKLVKKNHELRMKQRTQGMFAVEMQKFVREKGIFKDQIKMKAAALVRQKGRVRLLKTRCKTMQRSWQHETYARRRAVKNRDDLAVELQQKHSLMEKEASEHQFKMQQMVQQCDSLAQVNETLRVGLRGVSGRLTELKEEVNAINSDAQVKRALARLQYQEFQNKLQSAHETTVASFEQTQQDLAQIEKICANLVEILAKKDKEKLELENVMADERRKHNQDVKALQKEINQKVESKNNKELLLTVRNNELVTTVVRLDEKIKILVRKHVKKMIDFKVNWATKMNHAVLATNKIKSEKKRFEDKCKKMQKQLKISQVELDAKKRRLDQLEASKFELQTRNQKLVAGLKRTARRTTQTNKDVQVMLDAELAATLQVDK